MLCLPYLTKESDKPFWVKRDLFFTYFDQEDFLCRECIDVELTYLRAWFYEDSGVNYFNIPAFQIINGRTQFINGRHRTAVLLHFLDCLPIAYVQNPMLKNNDLPTERLLQSVVHCSLDLCSYIKLPDLPMQERIFTKPL